MPAPPATLAGLQRYYTFPRSLSTVERRYSTLKRCRLCAENFESKGTRQACTTTSAGRRERELFVDTTKRERDLINTRAGELPTYVSHHFSTHAFHFRSFTHFSISFLYSTSPFAARTTEREREREREVRKRRRNIISLLERIEEIRKTENNLCEFNVRSSAIR